MTAPRTSELEGVAYGRIVRNEDERGTFQELWRASAAGPTFVQANLSTSVRGVLRGVHVHRRQLDHWIVITGTAFVALVDVRPLVAEPGARVPVESRTLTAGDWVRIPAGVAHGFLALEDLEFVYLVTNEYDGTDELGFAWNDPHVGIPWPSLPATADGGPILSDRDRSNASLQELVERIRRER